MGIREDIKNTLESAKNPCALVSFGKDSMLLLSYLRAFDKIPLIWFQSDLSYEQKKFARSIIREWDLTVFGYAPAQRYYVPDGDNLTLVNEYAMNDRVLPVLIDIEHSDKCGLLISQQRTPQMRWDWDVTLTGWKTTDSHPLLSNVNLDGTVYAGTSFVSPLRDLTDEEVFEMLAVRNIPYDRQRYAGGVDSDTLYACTRCLTGQGDVFCPDEQKMIASVGWDKQASLNTFYANVNH